MDSGIKDDPEMMAQLALGLAGVSNVPLVWSQAGANVQAPQAHMTTVSQQLPTVPPPAHAHSSTTNQKPPDTFLDKGLIDAAAYLDGKSMSLPLKTADNSSSESSSGLPWSLQNALFQQYGQFMLDRIMTKQTESSNTVTVTATATTDTVAVTQSPSSLSTLPTSQPGGKIDSDSEPGAIEARDVYRRMLNYSSALTQQYYLSQYGYNYMQDRTLFSKAEPGQTSTVTTATASHAASNPSSINHNSRAQLPSIDSVLLNLSTKKTTTTASTPQGSATLPSTASLHSIPANYGLQALANAAIEADPKAFSEAETERKDGQKSELEDITDTDDSNTMSPSDGSTGQIMSPSRHAYAHLLDNNPPISIPAAHSHSQQYSSLYQTKSAVGAVGTLPSIQHFAALGKAPTLKPEGVTGTGLQLPVGTGIKPSDLVAAAMKLKVEPSEEKELADRAIQERITAHHLNAVQQQVQDLTAGALAAHNIDAAALLAKLQSANLESELQKQMERVYDYEESVQTMQHEPMELTADGGSPGRRRKSRGRPTSIESLRDPLGRQSSTTSSLGANTSISGDGDDRTYDCEICGKQFSHNDRLRRHRKIHTSEKPYKCDICGKGFKEKCNLKHHRYIHTGEKPYKCDTCGKSFNQRSSLKTHQKVHTGEKPFKCELCEKPFAQKYLLRQHMKKHIEINMPLQHQQQQQHQQHSQHSQQ